MLKVKLKRQFHDLTPQDSQTDALPQVGVKRKKIDSSRLEDETKWLLVQEMQVKQLEEIQRIRNEEHKRLVFALKNQRQRLHYEKMAELSRQKDMFERLLRKLKNKTDDSDSSENENSSLNSNSKNTSDVEVNGEKNVDCVDLDQKTAGLRLLKVKYKNKMLSSCRSYSWRTKDLHLSAMTPIEEEEEDSTNWLEEKKRLNQEKLELKEKLWSLEQRQTCLEVDLQEARDQNELLEFRILEVEQTSNSEFKRSDKCVNTDSFDGLIKEIVQTRTDDNLAEKIRTLEAECNTLRIENKNLTIKLISMSQMSTSTQESITDSLFDNRSDVVSQGGETGYSSDEYEDMNANLSSVDVTSPTPSIDSANAVEFDDIVQKINGLNGENLVISGNNFPGSLEELNLRNKVSRSNACNDFFWSLSEVAHKIKESEDVKNKLRAHVRNLEDELKRVINENDALKQEKSFEIGKKLDFNFCNENNGENVDLDSCGIDVIKNLLTEKERELHNKEVEYSLKVDALKCDVDETVNRLESRLEMSLKTEIEFREKIDTLEQEKRNLMDQMKEKDEIAEMDKIALTNQIRSIQQAKEKLEERIVMQNNRMGGRQLFSVTEEVYGDDTEERLSDKSASKVEENVSEELTSYTDGQNECQQESVVNKQLKQRLFELEKKERAYRETLHEADKIMADVERSYQERIDEQEAVEERLRARIVQLEQSEKRLRQALRNTKHNNEVSKFGELLDRLLETEASERRLKSRIHELEKEDREIKQSLTDAQREKCVMEQELQDQEELLRLVSDLRCIEKELRSKIAQLETSEGALKETLIQADAILMEREMALKEKVEQLEAELMSLRQEKGEHENTLGDQHPNRVQSMADVLNLNAKLELQVEELEEINSNLRNKLFEIESENTRLNKQNSDVCSENNNNDLCLKMNLEILDRDSQIERLSDKIKILEAGNIPMELQALSLHADELKQLKEKINSLSAFVQHCNCGNCSICQPLLADIENQVKLLDEIISGNTGNSVEMKEEKHINDGCQTQDLISLNNDKVDDADHKEVTSLPKDKYDIMEIDENSENVTLQFQNNNKTVKTTYKNKFTYCSIDEIEELKSRISQLEKETINKDMLREVSDQQIKSLQMKISIFEQEVAEKIAEVSKLSAEKMSIQQENESFQHRVWKAELSERVLQEKYLKKSQAVVAANKQVRDLEQKIGVLSRQLRHWETSHRESINFKEKIQDLESELQKRRENERKLYAENLHLHHKVESQRERINSMQVMKKDYQMLTNKVDLLEKKKSIVEQSIPTLKNRISQLSQRCKDKDQIINRLDKQVQNKIMSPIRERKQNLNKHNSHDESSFDKDEKHEFRDEYVTYSVSAHHSLSSDNSDSSNSPRQVGSKSKIPRYTALPSPTTSPRNKTVHFEKNAWEEEKLNIRPNKHQISPKSSRKNQRIKRTSGSEEKNYKLTEDEPSFAPLNFRVTRKVAPDSLLVAWTVPNGLTNLSGYLIFVNDELHQKVRSPNRTKALLNRLDLSQDIKIAIQTLLDNGASSEKVRLNYPSIQTDKSSDDSPPNSARSLDEKSFSNYKRQCIVCEDYTPTKSEDNKPTFELQVNQGDIVTIFGCKSANNFYYAEADGKRGILPAVLLQKISSLKKSRGDSLNTVVHSD